MKGDLFDVNPLERLAYWLGISGGISRQAPAFVGLKLILCHPATLGLYLGWSDAYFLCLSYIPWLLFDTPDISYWYKPVVFGSGNSRKSKLD